MHHIIPISVLEKSKKLQEVILWMKTNRPAFDFNGLSNAIPLEIAHHGGGHPQYIKKMIDIFERDLTGNLQADALYLERFINDMRTKIETDIISGNVSSINNLTF